MAIFDATEINPGENEGFARCEMGGDCYHDLKIENPDGFKVLQGDGDIGIGGMGDWLVISAGEPKHRAIVGAQDFDRYFKIIDDGG